MNFRFGRDEAGKNAAKTKGVLAQLRPDPVLTGGCRIALIEDEIDDLQHRRQAGRAISPDRDLEGNARLGKGPLGADDPLGHRRFRNEKCPRDLSRRQTTQQAECQCRTALGRKHRMTGGEDQTQEVVAHVVVGSDVELLLGHCLLGRDDLAAQLLVLALERLAPAERVDGAVLRGAHQPGAGLVGNARPRPLFQGGHQRVLRQFLGKTDVAHDPCQAGDEPGGLDSPDGVNGAMNIGTGHSRSITSSSIAQACLLLPQLRREVVTEVVGFEYLANLDLALIAGGIGNALDPLDRLFL